jgi:hypothetical protein
MSRDEGEEEEREQQIPSRCANKEDFDGEDTRMSGVINLVGVAGR